MKCVEIAGLPVRIAGGTDQEGAGNGPVVVLLHGFGAPGDNLVPLWRVLDAAPTTRWVFPGAPLVLQTTPVEARAWWMIDIDRLVSRRGQSDEAACQVPVGLREARERVIAVLDEIDARLHPSKTVLGGFSQGAMLACDVALRTKRPLAGLVLLSSTLIAADEWIAFARDRTDLRVLLSHGQADAMLPFAYAERLRDLLRDGGTDVTWVPFRGGHEIPDNVVDSLRRWLLEVIG